MRVIHTETELIVALCEQETSTALS